MLVVSWNDVDFDGAASRLEAMQEELKRRADDAQRVADRLQTLTTTTTSADGAIKVTLDATGALVGLELTEAVRSKTPQTLAADVLRTSDLARAALLDQATETVADGMGDTPWSAEVLASLNHTLRPRRSGGDAR